ARREDRRNDEARDTGGEIVPDEIGIEPVHGLGRGQAGVAVVDEEQKSDQEEQRELEEDDCPACEQGLAAIAFGARGEKALDHELLGAMARGGEEAAADNAGPEAVVAGEKCGRQRKTEIE